MDQVTRYRQARNVTLLGAVLNIALAVIKMVFGYLGKSQALIADGFHSFSDLLSDVVVLIATRYGSADADRDHPYGHRRVETMASMILALLLVLIALGIAYDAIIHLNVEQAPDRYVLVVVGIAILVKEFLYQYTQRVARKLKSKLLSANAWHHRSDAASSVVVLVGVAGALLGFTYLDAIAALIVALLILKMAWDIGWSSARELVDTAVDDELLAQIKHVILQTNGVVGLHQLRTRSMGNDTLVDVHVLVNGQVSVSEGHHIAQQVHLNLVNKLAAVSDVTVHIDPEEDDLAERTQTLPSRNELLPELDKCWQVLPGYRQAEKVILHYEAGRMQVDVYLSTELLAIHSEEVLRHQYHQAVTHLMFVRDVNLYFTGAPSS